MIRTFRTHRVREQKELTGCLWEFIPCQGEKAGRVYQVPTPGCWENHPDFSGYRGEGIYKTIFWAEGTIRLEFKGVVDEYRRRKMSYDVVKKIFESYDTYAD